MNYLEISNFYKAHIEPWLVRAEQKKSILVEEEATTSYHQGGTVHLRVDADARIRYHELGHRFGYMTGADNIDISEFFRDRCEYSFEEYSQILEIAADESFDRKSAAIKLTTMSDTMGILWQKKFKGFTGHNDNYGSKEPFRYAQKEAFAHMFAHLCLREATVITFYERMYPQFTKSVLDNIQNAFW